jgi:hypothetical protein
MQLLLDLRLNFHLGILVFLITASKNDAQFKSGQNQLKNNQLASLI